MIVGMQVKIVPMEFSEYKKYCSPESTEKERIEFYEWDMSYVGSFGKIKTISNSFLGLECPVYGVTFRNGHDHYFPGTMIETLVKQTGMAIYEVLNT